MKSAEIKRLCFVVRTRNYKIFIREFVVIAKALGGPRRPYTVPVIAVVYNFRLLLQLTASTVGRRRVTLAPDSNSTVAYLAPLPPDLSSFTCHVLLFSREKLPVHVEPSRSAK